jgi:uncharacterized protein
MTIIPLPFIRELEENLRSSSTLIQVILGPRQVGKTTTTLWFLEKQFSGRFHYVSADKVFNTEASWLLEQWTKARREQKILIVDEIQKVENWAEIVKSLWDADKRNGQAVQTVLLGSSSLEIQKGLSESLTGRFKLIKAHHWNYTESAKAYGLTFEQFLAFGGYPGSYQFINNKQEWRDFVKNSIVGPVIEKDILLYQTVKSPSLFKQAFEILRSYPAQEISYTKLLGQLQDRGNTELVKYYLSLYEGAYLFKSLPKYSVKTIKTRSSSPKIFPLCPAFYYLDILDEYKANEKGRVFELVVGTQLQRMGLELYYWREGTNEVDYVVKMGRRIWAVEVKSGRKKSPKGLDAFCKKFPEATPLFITFESYQEFERDPFLFFGIGV